MVLRLYCADAKPKKQFRMPEQQDSPDLPDQAIGHESQLGEWFAKLEKPLMIYAYQTLNDRVEAMDMVQEAFVRFFKEEGRVREPKAWLYRTTRNLCISHLRKHGRMKTIGEEEQMDFLDDSSRKEEDPAKQMERKEARGRVRHALSMLPDDLRELIKMKFDQKMSYKEISEKSGLSISNVGYKLHTVIKDLAVEMKAEGFAS